MHPVNHPLTGKPDKRYTVATEYTGAAEPQYVVRFMDEWITSRPTLEEAIQVCKKEARQRWESL